MKLLIIMLLSTIVLASCEKTIDTPPPIDKPGTETPVINADIIFADGTNITPTLSYNSGKVVIKFSSKKAWTSSITPGATWCTITPNSGTSAENITITISVTKNETGKDRMAKITLMSDQVSKEITITQDAFDLRRPAITVNVSDNLESKLSDISGIIFSDITKLTIDGTKELTSDELTFISNGLANLTILDLGGSATKSIPNFIFIGNHKIESVIFPSGLTSIGNTIFSGSHTLKSITLPGTIEDFGSFAFSPCVRLKNITLMEGLKTIGAGAFSATGIETIIIPKSVERIENSAFSSCNELRVINIPENVKFIGYSTFEYCRKLKVVTSLSTTPPVLVFNIKGESVFNLCPITDIFVPVSSIPEYKKAEMWGGHIDPIKISAITSF